MSSVGPVALTMSAGVHTGECHFFLTELAPPGAAGRRPGRDAGVRARRSGHRRRDHGQRRDGREPRHRLARRGRERAALPADAVSSRARARSRRLRSCPGDDLARFVPARCGITSRSRAARRSTARSRSPSSSVGTPTSCSRPRARTPSCSSSPRCPARRRCVLRLRDHLAGVRHRRRGDQALSHSRRAVHVRRGRGGHAPGRPGDPRRGCRSAASSRDHTRTRLHRRHRRGHAADVRRDG